MPTRLRGKCLTQSRSGSPSRVSRPWPRHWRGTNLRTCPRGRTCRWTPDSRRGHSLFRPGRFGMLIKNFTVHIDMPCGLVLGGTPAHATRHSSMLGMNSSSRGYRKSLGKDSEYRLFVCKFELPNRQLGATPQLFWAKALLRATGSRLARRWSLTRTVGSKKLLR